MMPQFHGLAYLHWHAFNAGRTASSTYYRFRLITEIIKFQSQPALPPQWLASGDSRLSQSLRHGQLMPLPPVVIGPMTRYFVRLRPPLIDTRLSSWRRFWRLFSKISLEPRCEATAHEASSTPAASHFTFHDFMPLLITENFISYFRISRHLIFSRAIMHHLVFATPLRPPLHGSHHAEHRSLSRLLFSPREYADYSRH